LAAHDRRRPQTPTSSSRPPCRDSLLPRPRRHLAVPSSSRNFVGRKKTASAFLASYNVAAVALQSCHYWWLVKKGKNYSPAFDTLLLTVLLLARIAYVLINASKETTATLNQPRRPAEGIQAHDRKKSKNLAVAGWLSQPEHRPSPVIPTGAAPGTLVSRASGGARIRFRFAFDFAFGSLSLLLRFRTCTQPLAVAFLLVIQ